MKNEEDSIYELLKKKQTQLIYEVECQLNRMEHERHKLEDTILKFQAACIDAGFKIAKIQYRQKNDKDEWEQERWYKWDSHLKK